MKEIYAFYNTHSKYTKNYGSHKENYLRFSIRVLIDVISLPISELIEQLEKQYIQNREDQILNLDGKEYLIRVLV
ncbi:hypothetical protein FA048_11880 [Pedobacter polaris]|uniref:Uncharacterized protein n=1 Tax=Pedobacter polaris TaxID=2571273 RepID=A0A4U1CUQ0_9SPHI|nr:hypothetical protein [Pedobacter polaris]TKC10860.1 hypothetical protein FA048_11880 [Pedobacter polaris]